MIQDLIENWLEQLSIPEALPAVLPIPSQSCGDGRASKRRKLSRAPNQRYPISPAPSSRISHSSKQTSLTMDPETPQKRKTPGPPAADDDETPRPNKAASTSSVFEKAPSLSSRSDVSGRSSPTKNFPIFGAEGSCIECETMNPNHADMPQTLAELVLDMQDIGACVGVIPRGLRDEVERLSEVDLSLRRIRGHAYCQPGDEDDWVPTDASSAQRFLAGVAKLVKKAGQCHHLQQDETGWNHLVHTPLLDASLDSDEWQSNDLVDVSPCMNASIMPAYHKFLTPTTKVDYVLSIKPAADSAAADEAISNLQRTANGSANHTAFGPLCHNPISVSIETKRHGGDARKADVQLATWQAAQWTFFRSRASAEAIRRLEFLPGVVVQGHEWKFTATTWEDGKTTLWSSHQFGSTATTVGVLQVMAGLRRLRRWAVGVFWPWYKDVILELGMESAAADEPVLAPTMVRR